ncbi:hypothetical protein Cgig2_000202 [Carnegiea gigantea]|uniref:CCHC-type domain-containing protein n=1 Tax=Carnegiea gigantea TaxID=171969 RepID=A0A9Q1QMU8_9CARY|nr:hypothetical protein Cgig2_000202 [Carnegiea gigantea]
MFGDQRTGLSSGTWIKIFFPFSSSRPPIKLMCSMKALGPSMALLLRELTGLEQPSEVEFSKARFSVKAMDVPPLKQTSSFAKVLGDNLGMFINYDDSNLYCTADKSVNFQVDVDVTKLLRRGIRAMVQCKPLWITLKYVKLPEFCYGCGRLGHTLKDCETIDLSMDEALLQYDEPFTIEPGTDAFKRKLEDRDKSALSDRKKKGSPDKPQSTLDFFRETFSDCGLHDLGYSSYDYTWWNHRDGDRSVEGRLDRYCASIELSLLFPMAKNVHVDAKLSDHLLIILNLRGEGAKSRRAKRSVNFENMWSLDKDYEDVIKSAWKVDITSSNIEMVEENLDACAKALAHWNSSSFS